MRSALPLCLALLCACSAQQPPQPDRPPAAAVAPDAVARAPRSAGPAPGGGVRRRPAGLGKVARRLDQALPDWRQWLLRAGWRLRPDFRPNPADPGAGVLLAGERSGPAEVGLLLRPRRHITELVLIVQGDSA